MQIHLEPLGEDSLSGRPGLQIQRFVLRERPMQEHMIPDLQHPPDGERKIPVRQQRHLERKAEHVRIEQRCGRIRRLEQGYAASGRKSGHLDERS